MEARVHPLGIRHHGPGSAASLLAALDRLDPAAVLIEGAPEAEPLLHHASAPGMKPPLAILIYEAETPANALFAPFAEFSPEWQAIRWALARERPIRLIDWPAAHALARPAEPAEGADADPDAEPAPPDTPGRGDPMDRLAELAGHEDGESWWNALVEQRGAGEGVFAAVESAVTALRAVPESRTLWSPRELERERRREAFMRLGVRRALKEFDGPLAVVVGAWHVPALRASVPQAEDRQTVRDLPKVKVEATWAPWTDSRLAARSGYGAGVVSPGWYAHLWEQYAAGGALSPVPFAAGWQARVAGLLRDAGQSVASASAIEAARLSLALAALRDEPAPGLADMRDASLSALCHGEAAAFRVVERRLLIGERIGEVGEGVPQTPLAQDLERWQRKTRLKPEAVERQIAVDLRTEAGLLKSTLLHRLRLIEVTWGRLLEADAGRGTFRETWELVWDPELSVKLAEALVHGVTIEQAAAGSARARAAAGDDVGVLADLVRACLLADLPDAADACIARLQSVAVDTGDIAKLMSSVPPLVEVLRYGTARALPEAALTRLVATLSGEVNAGVRIAARDLEDEVAAAFRLAMGGYDRALALLGDEHLGEVWVRELGGLAGDERAAPGPAGLALRLLHDRQAQPLEAVAGVFSRALTPPASPKAAGLFVESFLTGGADVLVQDRPLLGLIDAWLSGLDEDTFVETLPLLRRGFSGFEPAGRRRLLELVRRGAADATPASSAEGALSPAFEAALPLLRLILGMSDG